MKLVDAMRLPVYLVYESEVYMTHEQLMQIFKYVGECHTSSYDVMKLLHDLYKPENFIKVHLHERLRREMYRADANGHYTLQPPNENDLLKYDKYWCTQSDCTRSTIKLVDGEFVAEVRIDDKVFGEIKFKMMITFKIPNFDLTKIENLLEATLNRDLDNEYEDYLMAQRRIWITKQRNRVLKGIKHPEEA